MDYACCTLCPRMCRADRRKSPGYCGCGAYATAARAALHLWEEPCISGIDSEVGSAGAGGSGAVFFSGCTLCCCFCQNHTISSGHFGVPLTAGQLGDVFLRLQEQGAYNINLVTATQYVPDIIKALDIVKPRLVIPVVYNSGGYERVETLKELEGYVDIYLPDLKYLDTGLSARYSNAPDYFQFAGPAIKEMIRQTGKLVWDEAGVLLKRGTVIRHMVLPGCREDSIRLLRWIKDELPSGCYLLSLLSQYTPLFKASDYPEINRPITTFEYQRVVDAAIELGLTHGYMQEKSSAGRDYIPSFQLEGLGTE